MCWTKLGITWCPDTRRPGTRMPGAIKSTKSIKIYYKKTTDPTNN